MSKPAAPESNPLLNPPELPHGAPPLDKIRTEHFLPAFRSAMAEAKQQIADIRNNRAKPTFENTIAALEFSGQNLSRISSVFGNFSGGHSSEELRAIETEISVAGVKHSNDIWMDAGLFARVKAVHDDRASLKLSPEQAMLLEETYKGFVRSGALLDDDKKAQLRAVDEKLAELSTTFKNNALKATAAYSKVIDNEDDLKGLPDRVKAMYKHNAEQAGKPDNWIIKLSPPPIDIAEYSENRALREEIYKARCNIAFGGEFDNRQVVLDIVAQRQRKAELLGYDDFASFVLSERMAKDSKTVLEFLEKNQERSTSPPPRNS